VCAAVAPLGARAVAFGSAAQPGADIAVEAVAMRLAPRRLPQAVVPRPRRITAPWPRQPRALKRVFQRGEAAAIASCDRPVIGG
jgi:hypothetical protein